MLITRWYTVLKRTYFQMSFNFLQELTMSSLLSMARCSSRTNCQLPSITPTSLSTTLKLAPTTCQRIQKPRSKFTRHKFSPRAPKVRIMIQTLLERLSLLKLLKLSTGAMMSPNTFMTLISPNKRGGTSVLREELRNLPHRQVYLSFWESPYWTGRLPWRMIAVYWTCLITQCSTTWPPVVSKTRFWPQVWLLATSER